MKVRLTIGDRVLMAISAIMILLSYVLVSTAGDRGTIVLIEVNGGVVHKALLAETQTIQVQGVHGSLTVEIQEGKVSVRAAECPNRICVRTGWRSRAGEVIVCVPNKTLIRILGELGSVRATTG
jgi:hypothetical protein